MPKRLKINAKMIVAFQAGAHRILHDGCVVVQGNEIIHVGNIPETEITTPPLSTIGQPTIDFQPFADLLFSRLAAKEPLSGRVVELHQHLILRGSA